MWRATIAELMLLLLTSAAHCQTVPVLPVNTNWGVVKQTGRDFTIRGHERWEAVGRIRDDGRVFVLWTLLSSGDPCPGVYDIKDGELRGFWGFADSVEIGRDGSITGSVQADLVHAVEAPPVEDL